MADLGAFSGINDIQGRIAGLVGDLAKAVGELNKLKPAAQQAIAALDEVKKREKERADAAAQHERERKMRENLPLQPGQWVTGPGRAGGVTLAEGFSITGGYQWPVWGELLTPEQKLAQGAGVPVTESAIALADAFKALSDRINKWQGDDNNYWSQLLTKEIPYLTKGATSVEDANAMIRAILNQMLPGIMQELANPRIPLEMRRILETLEHYAISGDLKLDNLAERYEKSNTAQKEIDATLADLNKKFAAADQFAQDIGKIRDDVSTVKGDVGAVKQGQKEVQATVSAGISTLTRTSTGPGLATSAAAATATAAAQGEQSKQIEASIGKGTSIVVSKIQQTAADQKAAAKAIMDSLNRESNELKQKMKEAADQAKRDAEETHKRLGQIGDEMLHGPSVPVTLSDELERWRLAHGGGGARPLGGG